MKKCVKCKVEKPATEFHRNKTMADGLTTRCKACAKEYQQLNREKVNAATKKWQQENKDKVAAQVKKWQQENKAKVAANSKKWQQENKAKLAANQQARRKADKAKTDEASIKRQQENKAKAAARVKKWQQENKAKVAAYQKASRQKKADEAYDQRLRSMGFSLAILKEAQATGQPIWDVAKAHEAQSETESAKHLEVDEHLNLANVRSAT
jgi:membrane protein involved in colicin uptake